MPASQLPSYWEEGEFGASPSPDDQAQEALPAYSESATAQEAPSSSGQSSQLTLSKVRSAVWSFIKGDIYKHHPALVQERYYNAMAEAQSAKSRSRN